jgi:4-carboxymuconolactone decarboxylase
VGRASRPRFAILNDDNIWPLEKTMRLTPITRGALAPDQQQVLDDIEQGPRAKGRPGIGLIGPFGVWVRAPGVGGPIQKVGEAIRFTTSLAANVQEVAICTVGAFYHSKFEFSTHKGLAIKAGVSESRLNLLRDGADPGFAGDELLAYQIAREMLSEHGISDATYKLGLERFAETGMIEMVATVGYYCLISLTLNAFRIPLQPGMADPFPG